MSRTLSRAAIVLALAVGATLLFPATSIGDTFKIKMAGNFTNFRYEPNERHIVKRDRIKFKNPASQPSSHTVTAYGGNWDYNKNLSAGERVTRKFRRRGTFKFFCRFHGDVRNGQCTGMCGKVKVHRP